MANQEDRSSVPDVERRDEGLGGLQKVFGPFLVYLVMGGLCMLGAAFVPREYSGWMIGIGVAAFLLGGFAYVLSERTKRRRG